MARKLENASYLAADWKDEIESKNALKAGWLNIEFTHLDDDVRPTIIASSNIDLSGSIYVFDTDEIILDSTSDGLIYVIIDSLGVASFTNDVLPLYDYDRKGFYGLSDERFILQLKKAGTNYINKEYLNTLVQTKVGIPRNASSVSNIDSSFEFVTIENNLIDVYPAIKSYEINPSQSLNSIETTDVALITETAPTSAEQPWQVKILRSDGDIETLAQIGMPIPSDVGSFEHNEMGIIKVGNFWYASMSVLKSSLTRTNVYRSPDFYSLTGQWTNVTGIADSIDNGLPEINNKVFFDEQSNEMIWTKSAAYNTTETTFQLYTSSDGSTWVAKGRDVVGTWAGITIDDLIKVGGTWCFVHNNSFERIVNINDISSIVPITIINTITNIAKFDDTGFVIGYDSSNNMQLSWSIDSAIWTTTTLSSNTIPKSLQKVNGFYCLRVLENSKTKELWFNNLEDLKSLSNYETVSVRVSPYKRDIINIVNGDERVAYNRRNGNLYDWGWNKPWFIDEE